MSSTTTTTFPPYTHPQWIEPYFDPTTPRNVTALMGKSAYLSCRVRNLGNKTVSKRQKRVYFLIQQNSLRSSPVSE